MAGRRNDGWHRGGGSAMACGVICTGGSEGGAALGRLASCAAMALAWLVAALGVWLAQS